MIAAFAYESDEIGPVGVSILIFCVAALILFLFLLPMDIAKKRGVWKERRSYITVLSFLGIFLTIPWFIALALAFSFSAEKDENERGKKDNDYLFKLSKLGKLKEEGVLTDEEFEEEKQKILGG